MSAAIQTWDPETYGRHARFVSDLGAPVFELLALQAGERILDLGCGDGVLTAKLVEAGGIVVAVDSSELQVRAAHALGLDARVLAPAKGCVVLEASQDDKQFTVTAFDPLKGRDQVLRTIQKDPATYHSGLSPDGSTFAISKTGEADIHICLLPLAGGSDGEVTVKGWPNLTDLFWASNGKGFYCGSAATQGRTLLYVDLKGNAKVLWRFKGTGEFWGVPSPDGRYVAIQAPVYNSNAWMLEGF